MASGYSTSGYFPTVVYTGTISSIATHASKGGTITSSKVSISGDTAVAWSNVSDILANYVVVTRNVNSGNQHCLISGFSPSRDSGYILSVWNQDDSTMSPSYTIAGLLIPKDLCTELT